MAILFLTILHFLFALRRLVIKQMAELDGDRRCWQQIGPVLAQKKVSDTLPVLATNRVQVRHACASRAPYLLASRGLIV
jgi:hypothetical protein